MQCICHTQQKKIPAAFADELHPQRNGASENELSFVRFAK